MRDEQRLEAKQLGGGAVAEVAAAEAAAAAAAVARAAAAAAAAVDAEEVAAATAAMAAAAAREGQRRGAWEEARDAVEALAAQEPSVEMEELAHQVDAPPAPLRPAALRPCRAAAPADAPRCAPTAPAARL